MPRGRKTEEPATTAQRLSSIIKSARDIMRKDKGLSGDLDRLPMLTWIMFLKFLDDMEDIREAEATLQGRRFTRAVEPPYRWRDWAAQEDGITGNELISFINNDEVVRPDGTRGLGLFAYLKSLQGEDGIDRRDVIATVFREINNRMISGYLIRDVINKVNTINFTSSEEIHTLSFFYETMLREMRDAAGDSGEFYTPRPIIQLMVAVVDPKLGESILDPASGTCGFLVESFEYLKKQCNTTEDLDILHKKTIYGGEAKPLPYLLGQMNMLLHGIESPQIDYGNSLRFPLREIGDRDRVDIILTNPPFGGEEERGILSNFPADKKTTETALLFLQLLMRKLKRKTSVLRGGRCGMVVPNGTLFSTGIGSSIKKELVETFNLHTIIRLPKGVFSPYTNIETNLLFFEKGEPTEEIWYYEHPLPPERQKLANPCYTKTKPLRYEEFEPLIKWWNNRAENENAWKVLIKEVVNDDYNLDIKNPNKEKEVDLRSPEEIITNIIGIEMKISTIIQDIQIQIKKGWEYEK